MRKERRPKHTRNLSNETVAVATGIMAAITLLSPLFTHLDTSLRIFQALSGQDVTCEHLIPVSELDEIQADSIVVLSAGVDHGSGLPNIESSRRVKAAAYLYTQLEQNGSDPSLVLLNDKTGEGMSKYYLRNKFQFQVKNISKGEVIVPNEDIESIIDGDSTISQIRTYNSYAEGQGITDTVFISSKRNLPRLSVIACNELDHDFELISMEDVFEAYNRDLSQTLNHRQKPSFNRLKYSFLEIAKTLSVPYR